MAIASDGAVWVTEPYRLVRVNPATGSVTEADLDLQAAGAIAGAYDPNGKMPGTWVSSIARWNDGVVVARNNVPYLTSYEAGMTATGTIAVHSGFGGSLGLAQDAHGRLFLLAGLLGEERVAEVTPGATASSAVLSLRAFRLREVDGHDYLSGADAGMGTDAESAASGSVSQTGQLGSELMDRSYPSPLGGTVVYDFHGQHVTWVRDGAVVRDMPLPTAQGTSHGRTVELRTVVSDLVVDSSGVVWYFDVGNRALVGLAP